MIKVVFSICCVCSSFVVFAQKSTQAKDDKEFYVTNTYVVGMVIGGRGNITDSLEIAELHEGHVRYLDYLRVNKKLVASGPLKTDQQYRGLYIFNVETIGEAEAILAEDPAVKAGYLDMDLFIWTSRDASKMDNTSLSYKVIALLVFAATCVFFVGRAMRGKTEA